MGTSKPSPVGDITNWEHDESIRAKRVTQVDGDGNVISNNHISEGNLVKSLVDDVNGNILLNKILKELKKINLQLIFMTDNVVDNEEVE